MNSEPGEKLAPNWNRPSSEQTQPLCHYFYSERAGKHISKSKSRPVTHLRVYAFDRRSKTSGQRYCPGTFPPCLSRSSLEQALQLSTTATAAVPLRLPPASLPLPVGCHVNTSTPRHWRRIHMHAHALAVTWEVLILTT